MFAKPEPDMTERESHLRVIAIFHYVLGGLAAVFSMFPVIHLAIGLVLVFSPQSFDAQMSPPPKFVGWMFIGIAAVVIMIGLAFAICVIAAGRSLQKRKRYMFCLVMAGIECLFMPLGTVLGVFTIILLVKEDVKQLFVSAARPTPSRPT